MMLLTSSTFRRGVVTVAVVLVPSLLFAVYWDWREPFSQVRAIPSETFVGLVLVVGVCASLAAGFWFVRGLEAEAPPSRGGLDGGALTIVNQEQELKQRETRQESALQRLQVVIEERESEIRTLELKLKNERWLSEVERKQHSRELQSLSSTIQAKDRVISGLEAELKEEKEYRGAEAKKVEAAAETEQGEDDALEKASEAEKKALEKKRSNLMHLDLTGKNLSGIELAYSNVSGTKFVNANLEGARIGRSIAEGASFEGANLRKAWLQYIILDKGSLQGAVLTGADLYEARLQQVNLDGADLREATLRYSHLQGASLVNADLRRADLSCANFEGAILQGTRLEGVDLQETVGLTLEQISQANTDEMTRLPPHLRTASK